MNLLNLQLHPMMVHFPLALVPMGFLCLLASQLLKNEKARISLAHAGTWTVLLGGAVVYITLATGLRAAWNLRLHGAAQYSVSRHIIWAICSSQLVALLALWRGCAIPWDSRPGWLFMLLLLVACAGLIVTGYYGGENVYHYALGVDLKSSR